MLKAAKKLKFWSKNKNNKRRKTRDSSYFPPPPPPCCCCTCSCSAIQPSAPPLPPWLDNRTLLSPSEPPAAAGVEVAASYQQYMAPAPPLPPWLDDRTLLSPSEPPVAAGVEVAASYQQYMAPNPAYEVAIVEMGSARTRERSLFTDLGVMLVGCFCPCLRIREAYYLPHQ